MLIRTYEFDPVTPSFRRFIVTIEDNLPRALVILYDLSGIDHVLAGNSIYFAKECDRTLFLLKYKE